MSSWPDGRLPHVENCPRCGSSVEIREYPRLSQVQCRQGDCWTLQVSVVTKHGYGVEAPSPGARRHSISPRPAQKRAS